jgi:CheY-like chemotaxis protein
MLHVQDYDGRTPGSRDADGRGQVEERSQERRKHVFAINASPPFLNIIRELFQEEGYNVTTTNFAPNSFAQIEALQPDALIIDIAIGQDAGWELLEQLEADADTAGIPVLVVSTDPRLLTRAEAHAARYGTHRFLAKPLDLDAMLHAIREMIGEA